MPYCEKHKKFYVGVCNECKKEKVGTIVASTQTSNGEISKIKVNLALPIKISIKELEESLKDQIELLKSSKSNEELLRAKHKIITTLSKLALKYAESNMGIQLLNTLNDLKQYVDHRYYLKELEGAARYVELMVNERIPVNSSNFLDKLQILLNDIERLAQ